MRKFHLLLHRVTALAARNLLRILPQSALRTFDGFHAQATDAAMNGLIRASLKNPRAVTVMTLAILFVGYFCLRLDSDRHPAGF